MFLKNTKKDRTVKVHEIPNLVNPTTRKSSVYLDRDFCLAEPTEHKFQPDSSWAGCCSWCRRKTRSCWSSPDWLWKLLKSSKNILECWNSPDWLCKVRRFENEEEESRPIGGLGFEARSCCRTCFVRRILKEVKQYGPIRLDNISKEQRKY